MTLEPGSARRPLSAGKVGHGFYLRAASDCVTDFLGKVLVRQTAGGRVAGVICDVEAKLCRSFQITKDQYGADLTGTELFLENWDVDVDPTSICTSHRIGINARHDGHDRPLRYYVPPAGLPWLGGGRD